MATILLRRGTSVGWAAKNPVLAAGELGVDTTQSKIKLGDGVTAWNSLAFINAGGGGGSVGWGDIIGTLSSQADLQLALDAKANASHTHAISAVTGLQTALDGKLGVSAQASTVATINGLLEAGDNVTIEGAGTVASPYILSSTGGGGSNFIDGGVASSIYSLTNRNIDGGSASA
jgi:hypothetical protein